MKAALPVQSEQ